MKRKLTALFLSLALALAPAALAAEGGLFPTDTPMPIFTDLSADGKTGGGWYDYASIQVCVESGLMKGTGSGSTFSPSGTISVAEVATVCARINEKITGYTIPPREKGQPWYAPAIAVMEHIGVATPADPTVPATRADFVRLLAAVTPGESLAAVNSITALPDTADSDVLRFYNAGIVTGADKYGTFAGDRGLTRAEAALMLARVIKPALRKSFTLAVKPSDPVMDILGVSGDTAVFTVDGNAVTAQEYLYWLVYNTNYMAAFAFGGADAIDWAAEQDGQSISDFIKKSSLDMAVLYSVVRAEASKAGVTLTSEDLAAIDQLIADNRADYGEADFQAQLRKMGLTEEGFRSLMNTSFLYENLKKHLFGIFGQKELDAYVKESGTLRAKHILIADKVQAESVLAQLRAAGNSETTFDALMEQYSEDVRGSDGKLAAPDGYVFGPDYMVREFEDGVKALKVGEVSGLVQSQFGYHIILRLAVRAEDVQEDWTDVQMNAFLEAKVSSAVIKTTELYNKIDPRAVWEAVKAY